MKRIFLAILVSMLFTGCFSSKVMNESKEQVAIQKAVARNDGESLDAFRRGDFARASVQVSTWEAIKEQPAKLGAAGALDLGILYGTYEGLKSLAESWGDTTINVTGDNNTINN